MEIKNITKTKETPPITFQITLNNLERETILEDLESNKNKIYSATDHGFTDSMIRQIVGVLENHGK